MWELKLKRNSIRHNTMGRSRKNKQDTILIRDGDGQITEVSDVGVPGLFPAQQWDIDEEFQNNEALRELRREQQADF